MVNKKVKHYYTIQEIEFKLIVLFLGVALIELIESCYCLHPNNFFVYFFIAIPLLSLIVIHVYKVYTNKIPYLFIFLNTAEIHIGKKIKTVETKETNKKLFLGEIIELVVDYAYYNNKILICDTWLWNIPPIKEVITIIGDDLIMEDSPVPVKIFLNFYSILCLGKPVKSYNIKRIHLIEPINNKKYLKIKKIITDYRCEKENIINKITKRKINHKYKIKDIRVPIIISILLLVLMNVKVDLLKFPEKFIPLFLLGIIIIITIFVFYKRKILILKNKLLNRVKELLGTS